MTKIRCNSYDCYHNKEKYCRAEEVHIHSSQKCATYEYAGGS